MDRDHEPHWITSALAGDQSAFGLLIRRYSNPLLRFVRTLIGDVHHAEDVVQQVFLSAYRKLNQFDSSKGEFSTWLFRIARNQSLNHLRQHRRTCIEFHTNTPEPSVNQSPSDRALRNEQFRLLDAALAELPEQQRSAWFLSEVENMTQAQIAAIENIPEGTVKSRVARARDALRKSLAAKIGAEP